MNKFSNLILGLIFIIVGVIFGLNALNITNIDVFFPGWWTLLIIVPCFLGLFKEEKKTGNLIGIIIGVCLLLACLGFIKFEIIWKLMVPVTLVLIGLSVILKDAISTKIKKEISKGKKSETKEYYATFGVQKLNYNAEKFDGCELNAIFGGVECDLREAVMEEDVIINATAIFGGITIYVPQNINVKITSTVLFGGVSDERKKEIKNGKYTIYVNATSIFGGIEIK